MAEFEVGDIYVHENDWPGHVGIVYEKGDFDGNYCAQVMHATGANNFSLEPNQVSRGNSYIYNMENASVYRAPWDKLSNADYKRRLLKQVAHQISQYAVYGKYRAVRLFAGSSVFGKDARDRLNKYEQRWNNMFTDRKFITKITCAEAVILCYQLVFGEGNYPFFINLDAAHTMPRTLGTWLSQNWQTVKTSRYRKQAS